MTDIIEFISARLGEVLKLFTNPASFLSPFPLLIAALISLYVISQRQRAKQGELGGAKSSLLAQLLPREIINHPSAKTDLWIILINTIGFFFIPALATYVSLMTVHSLFPALDMSQVPKAHNLFTIFIFTIYSTLVWDFLASYAHYLKHKIPFLWEFHKVHHSAEVLTPLTAMRRHPFEALFSSILTGLGLALSTVIWVKAFGMSGTNLQLGGSLATIYLWRVLGYNIRHSHLWISYGPFWNKIFISPAHHQIHHSNSAEHYDTNFGHIFSFWDHLFGTLLHPEAVDASAVKFGIDSHESAELQSLKDIYLRPIIKAAKRFKLEPKEIQSSKAP